jgi:hypothetical protein
MHKLDPKLPPDQQEKRSMVAIEFNDIDVWLLGQNDEAAWMMRVSPVEVFEAASQEPKYAIRLRRTGPLSDLDRNRC